MAALFHSPNNIRALARQIGYTRLGMPVPFKLHKLRVERSAECVNHRSHKLSCRLSLNLRSHAQVQCRSSPFSCFSRWNMRQSASCLAYTSCVHLGLIDGAWLGVIIESLLGVHIVLTVLCALNTK